jgi:hypothetical protein
MENYKTGKILALIVMLFSGHVVAEKSEPLLNFKFNHLSNIQTNDYLTEVVPSTSSNELEFAQYDATWTYPWETTNMNIDLGVTLRHLSGFNNSTESLGNGYFQEVLPLLHASALYSLPLKGLSAGIEGSHLGSNTHQVFDYRAKVSYEWREGFGLQGGWQHQQFNLDNATDTGADYEKNGPFIDFYLNF